MKYKYGNFPSQQFEEYKHKIRKDIFFLLLSADKKANPIRTVDVDSAIVNLMYQLDGLNQILCYRPEVVKVITLLEEARSIYENVPFDFPTFRKLILDAGAEILKIKEDSDES
mgnify:FL=1